MTLEVEPYRLSVVISLPTYTKVEDVTTSVMPVPLYPNRRVSIPMDRLCLRGL